MEIIKNIYFVYPLNFLSKKDIILFAIKNILLYKIYSQKINGYRETFIKTKPKYTKQGEK